MYDSMGKPQKMSFLKEEKYAKRWRLKENKALFGVEGGGERMIGQACR